MTLSPEERHRYKRHLLLPEVGGQGQQALKAASVLVIGAGGLGCPILTYLAAAGIGKIGICDPDTVDLSNLQRQPLYTMDDLGANKSVIAAKHLAAINPEPEYIAYPTVFDEASGPSMIKDFQLIIEGVDRYAARFSINRVCKNAARPFLSTAIGRFDGQIALFEPGKDDHPCYRCLVPEAPTDEALCETEGVLGATPAVVGALAASEALKWICGISPTLSRAMLIYTGLQGTVRRVTLPKDPDCPECGILT